jgi:hypothetical protein
MTTLNDQFVDACDVGASKKSIQSLLSIDAIPLG